MANTFFGFKLEVLQYLVERVNEHNRMVVPEESLEGMTHQGIICYKANRETYENNLKKNNDFLTEVFKWIITNPSSKENVLDRDIDGELRFMLVKSLDLTGILDSDNKSKPAIFKEWERQLEVMRECLYDIRSRKIKK